MQNSSMNKSLVEVRKAVRRYPIAALEYLGLSRELVTCESGVCVPLMARRSVTTLNETGSFISLESAVLESVSRLPFSPAVQVLNMMPRDAVGATSGIPGLIQADAARDGAGAGELLPLAVCVHAGVSLWRCARVRGRGGLDR